MKKDLNYRIHARRTALGKTLEEVGKDVGVAKTTVQRWETGIISEMRRDKLVALAKSLQTSTSYLMGLTDDPEARSALNRYEAKLAQQSATDKLFQALAYGAGFSEQMDEDANVTLSKGDLVLNETPELIERVMDQTVDYFTYLLEREARR